METQASKFPHPMMWIAGVAITVFCAAGVAAIMGWIPTSIGRPGDNAAAPQVSAPQPPAPAARTSTAPAHVASNAPAHARCADCGVIESTREVDTQGEGSGVGAVGGAVAGGVLGHQVGSGRGNTAATVAGAAGGAYVGNQIEKNKNAVTEYHVIVNMEEGRDRTFIFRNPPKYRSGDKVRIIDGKLQLASQ
jgi:outer membrane lipoprotein SlyB